MAQNFHFATKINSPSAHKTAFKLVKMLHLLVRMLHSMKYTTYCNICLFELKPGVVILHCEK